ncbi:MAG TPA: cupin domain-containing protein [Gammaproteobacteria bacterium]|nr:cupin domain-containing protein [Gammaproteobacteria bacterium]
MRNLDTLTRLRSKRWPRRSLLACAATLSLAPVAAALAQPPAPAGAPPTLFSAPLADAPGKNLVVVELEFAPNAKAPSTPEQHPPGHRHPGSVYVYVTDGAVRLGVEGQPAQVVKAGGSFFEAVGAHHIISENASATEPARAIAVMIVPDGAPLVTRDEAK